MRIEPQAGHLGEEAMISRPSYAYFVQQQCPFMIVGDDEKVGFDNGKTVVSPPEKDSVLIVDLANPLDPKIVANLPLKNSVVGPPVNLDIDPTASVAIVADSSDGDVDTVSVIDLTAKPVRVIDHIMVPDSPEGLAFSPKSNLAVAVEATGSNKSKDEFYYHPHGVVTVLKVDGKKVTRLNDIEVGALPEAVGFTPDGRYIYVGNYSDRDFSILRVDGTKVTNTGKHFKVPGQPGSARMSPH
jgi:DNA-binding beta-propeller fold protein YncE